MSVKNAITFIKDVKNNIEIREKIYTMEQQDLNNFLNKNGYIFTSAELEDSINMLHLKCQTFEDAEEIMQIAVWSKFLFGSMN